MDNNPTYKVLKTSWNFLVFFVLGGLFGLLFYFHVEFKYEMNLFKALATEVEAYVVEFPENEKDSIKLLKSLEIVHNTINGRNQIFHSIEGVKSQLFQPLTVDLMTGQGNCGSYALVLARLLGELDRDVRMVQMVVDGRPGGHIVVEAKLQNSWVVLDPFYNLYFKNPEGSLASFSDIQHSWNHFKDQVPHNYDQSYRYEGLVYTNWNKIPVLMPTVKKGLDLVLGSENADSLSLRIVFLQKFRILFYTTLFIIVLTAILLFWKFIRTNFSKETSTMKVLEKKDGRITVIRSAKKQEGIR